MKKQAVNGIVVSINYVTSKGEVSEWALYGWSIDENGGASGSFDYHNGTATTFNASYSSPSSGTATHPLELFGTGGAFTSGGTSLAVNGMQIAGFMVFDTNLTSEQVDALYAAQVNRYSDLQISGLTSADQTLDSPTDDINGMNH